MIYETITSKFPAQIFSHLVIALQLFHNASTTRQYDGLLHAPLPSVPPLRGTSLNST